VLVAGFRTNSASSRGPGSDRTLGPLSLGVADRCQGRALRPLRLMHAPQIRRRCQVASRARRRASAVMGFTHSCSPRSLPAIVVPSLLCSPGRSARVRQLQIYLIGHVVFGVSPPRPLVRPTPCSSPNLRRSEKCCIGLPATREPEPWRAR
jgi:hypothetical protein